MNARARWFSFVLFLCALTAPLAAQSKLTLEAMLVPATAKPGDEVELVLTAKVAIGFHAYGTKETTNIPVRLKEKSLQLGGLERVGEAKVPDGMRKSTPIGDSFPLPSTFKVTQKLKVPAGFAGTEATIEGALDYQVCDENMCLAPSKEPFAVKLAIGGGAAAAGGEQKPVKPYAPGDVVSSTPPPPITQEPKPEVKPGLQLLPDTLIAVRATLEPATARPGETITLAIDALVDARYHAYGSKEKGNLPVELKDEKLRLGGLESAGDAVVPPGESATHFGAEAFPLPHEFRVSKRLKIPVDAKPGAITVRGHLDYQLCDENHCEPQGEIEFGATVTIEAGPARASATLPPTDIAPPVTQHEESESPFTSWWALILACIGGGLFALAMPCTYPMIPITFSFFTKQAEKNNGNVLALALTYGFGIVAMFVLVGVTLAGVIQPIVNHWATNAVIGVAFFVFAFALFGWINLSPPQSLQQAAGKASRSGGLLGVFFMGATLVITSFTCTAPIVGSLIAKVAELGTLRVGVGMAIFGLTMAIPFVFLSLAPGKVKALPKSGEWMETLKISLGFIELAAAFKFISMVDFYFGWQVLPRELFLLLWTAIFVLWAMYLFGILRKAGTPSEGVSNGRMAGGMAVTLFATYFLFGALGYRLDFYTTNFIPGYSAPSVLARQEGKAGGGHAAGEHRIVLDDEPKAVQFAMSDDKLLLYNFTGFN